MGRAGSGAVEVGLRVSTGLERGASDQIPVVSGGPSEENTRPRAAQRTSGHMKNRKKI